MVKACYYHGETARETEEAISYKGYPKTLRELAVTIAANRGEEDVAWLPNAPNLLEASLLFFFRVDFTLHGELKTFCDMSC